VSGLSPLGDILVLELTRGSYRYISQCFYCGAFFGHRQDVAFVGASRQSRHSRPAVSATSFELLYLLKLLYDMLASAVTNT